jgi:imidazole glycerol-phosphate synthase subunit HisH
MSKKVGIVSYGMGNLDSVKRALEECGCEGVIVQRGEELSNVQAVVLPGVGSFTAGMQELRQRGFDEALQRMVIEKGMPYLGICLGMQFMAEHGAEGGLSEGLGWIPGEVEKFQAQVDKERIPHVGWNEVHFTSEHLLNDQILSGNDFYFVHSYHLRCRNPGDILAKTPYCSTFTSIVGRNNYFGVQFHPEKSQRIGLRLLRNFLRLV